MSRNQVQLGDGGKGGVGVSWGIYVIQETFSLIRKTDWGVSRECGE